MEVTTAMSSSGINLGLSRISSLLAALRSPHLATPIVHISGTNGKGSVSAYLSSILVHSSLRVGRFNSPHLVDEWDCLQIGGVTVDRAAFEDANRTVREVDTSEGIGATSFELLTATAFEVFRRARPKLDLAVVEVGMGGATDATNVVDAERTLLSIVTSIELDHQKFLGDTVSDIARVKAGIVKKGGDVVLAKQEHPEVEAVLEQVSREKSARVWLAGEGTVISTPGVPTTSDDAVQPPLVSLRTVPIRTISPSPLPFSSSSPPILAHLPLPGSYQLANAAAATLAAQVLRTSPRVLSLLPSLSTLINPATMVSGIEATHWPGRLDWLSLAVHPAPSPPLRILLDGAHNPSSAMHLATYLATLPPSLSPTTLILGLSSPRSPISIFTPLLVVGTTITKVLCVPFTPPPSMPWIRPTSPGEIAAGAREAGVLDVGEFGSLGEALESCAEGEKVVVAGSLYLVADLYRLMRRGI